VIDGIAQPISEEPVLMPLGADQPGDVAVALRDGQVVIDAPEGTVLQINDQQVETRAVLAAGDRLRVGENDREILLVTMVT
jgi:hypothetical protein